MVRIAHAQMMTESPATLQSRTGVPVPLARVGAVGRLEGLLFELTVEQRYENRAATSIEAVFTFPLPVRAVLLGFDLEIGERKLTAHAVPRAKASQEYEGAIDAGDTAALIEHHGQGLYSVSLGNLKPRETAVIRYRYAELLDAHDGYVRVAVPTVIAPRYGDPRAVGLDGPTVPGVDLLGEYPFDIRVEVVGCASPAGVRSPSHAIETEGAGEGALVVRLAGASFLDRDFVLEIEHAAWPRHALVARDGDGCVVLASATLGIDRSEQRPLALKILLDCSGSMAGSSIAAAKRALSAILGRLRAEDRVSLSRFGSTVEHVTEGLEPADAHTVELLQALVRRTEANLGGTEMEAALVETLSIPVPEVPGSSGRTADLILITDGEIYDVAGVVARAARSGHRLFAIAIGAAPVEALARSLAEETGGACEFVGSSEDPEAAILRTFKRLRSAPCRLAAVDWPTPPTWTVPAGAAAFPGDTLHVIAGLAAAPVGAVQLTVRDEAGRETLLHVPVAAELTDGDVLPRLAAARRLAALSPDVACELAVKYQLATEHTSLVVVAVRAEGEKAEGLPATVAVPHMLAAGWSVTEMAASYAPAKKTMDAGVRMRRVSASDECSPMLLSELGEAFEARAADGPAPGTPTRPDGQYHLRLFSSTSENATPRRQGRLHPADRAALLRSLSAAYARGEELPRSLDQLASQHALPDLAQRELRALVDDGRADEEELVRVVLALLAQDERALGMAPQFLEAMRGNIAGDRAYRGLRRLVHERLFG